MNAVLLMAVLLMARIVAQLAYVQVVRDLQVPAEERYATMARNEIDRQLTIQPRRGTIRDRMGNVLALDVERESLYVVPGLVKPQDAPRLALVLSGLIGRPAADIQAIIQDHEQVWVRIKGWLDPEVAGRITLFKEQEPQVWEGFQLIHEPRRVYPQESFAAQVIGAVNLEGTGISGIEGYYDAELRGTTGIITAEVDAQNNPIWIAPQQTLPASNGADLELTIDPLVQHVIETELKSAVDRHDATGGTVIVMDPKTGAIRGMASYPSYDPNRYYDYEPEQYNLNPAIGKLYEPGSTFKIVTVAAGLQSRAFTGETLVDDTGATDRYGWSLSNWDSGAHGMITPGQVLYYSSNVGALKLNEITGPEKFYQMVSDFGFGGPTGVDLAGEEGGIVNSPATAPDWSPLTLDTNAFGQGIAATPLQIVRMVAAVGNDGKLMRPYIVQKRCHGDACETTRPEQIGQPIEPGVAWTIRRMLVNSANHYVNPVQPDNLWLVPGYQVGAKTGTSQIAENGAYSGQVIGSVAGLAPADNARYAILVKIDRPADDEFGVVTSLPVYQTIVEQLLRYERIAPDPGLVGPGQVAGVAYIQNREGQ